MKKHLVAAATLAAVAVICALGVPGALAATQTICPPGGLFDTTVNGGLLVTNGNYCFLVNDTIKGGVTIQSGSDIELDGSTVNNGITVMPGGEIEANPGSVFGSNPTTSTVYGGIALTNPNDWDIETTKIVGNVTFNGASSNLPTFCGNTVIGNVSMRNVSVFATIFGDPIDEGFDCPGNTISGSLSISNSSIPDAEANTIGGSVYLSGSTLEFFGNTVGGSLFCSNGTVIVPGLAGFDPTGNTVRGANTCGV